LIMSGREVLSSFEWGDAAFGITIET